MPVPVSADYREVWNEDLVIRNGVIKPGLVEADDERLGCCCQESETVQLGRAWSEKCEAGLKFLPSLSDEYRTE